MKPWQQKEWKEKRAAWLKDKVCDNCGSKDNLVIHHTKRIPTFFCLWRIIEFRLLIKCLNAGEFKGKIILGCPKCGDFRAYARQKRKFKKPVYRCGSCETEYDIPNKRIATFEEFPYLGTHIISSEDWTIFTNRYKEGIKEAVNLTLQDYHEYYLSLKDCVALCRKCHFKHHKYTTGELK
jgi:DNA-directed RNA polymerase subunit M/transcription elongation factor TFIIS